MPSGTGPRGFTTIYRPRRAGFWNPPAHPRGRGCGDRVCVTGDHLPIRGLRDDRTVVPVARSILMGPASLSSWVIYSGTAELVAVMLGGLPWPPSCSRQFLSATTTDSVGYERNCTHGVSECLLRQRQIFRLQGASYLRRATRPRPRVRHLRPPRARGPSSGALAHTQEAADRLRSLRLAVGLAAGAGDREAAQKFLVELAGAGDHDAVQRLLVGLAGVGDHAAAQKYCPFRYLDW